jgi:hypothetical protein
MFDDDVVLAEVDGRFEFELLEDLRFSQVATDLDHDVRVDPDLAFGGVNAEGGLGERPREEGRVDEKKREYGKETEARHNRPRPPENTPHPHSTESSVGAIRGYRLLR